MSPSTLSRRYETMRSTRAGPVKAGASGLRPRPLGLALRQVVRHADHREGQDRREQQGHPHRPDHRAGRPGVLRQERQRHEHERDQAQAERDERARARLGLGLARRGRGDDPGQQEPVPGDPHQRGQRDGPPLPAGRQWRRARKRVAADGPARRGHGAQPLTEPAVSPRTKYRCSEKNTTSGSDMEMNAAAVSSSQFSPRAPTSCWSATVSTRFSGVPPRNTRATSRSFHTHRNWKMAKAARAGTDSGMISRQKIVKWSAPSILADSMISDGNAPM